MLLNLGLPADAAASHRHEFSSTKPMTPTDSGQQQYSSYLYPLQYLQGRVNAFTEAVQNSLTAATGSKNAQEEPHQTAPSSSSESSKDDAKSVTESKHGGSLHRTVYQFAHPAPKRRVKRSQMILQIRRLGSKTRAAPVLEVFSGNLANSPATGNVRRRSSILKHGSKEGQRERLSVMSLDAQALRPREKVDEGSDAEDEDYQHLAASIFLVTAGGQHIPSEICIGEDHWSVSVLSSGAYQFLFSDKDGRKSQARWWPSRRLGSDTASVKSGTSTSERSFKFSLLAPTGRRHPVIGHMDRTAVEVMDQFMLPDISADSSSPSSSDAGSLATLAKHFHDCYFDGDQSAAKGILRTSDRTRLLIVVSGILVAIAEGWTHYTRQPDEQLESPCPSMAINPPKKLGRSDTLHSTTSSFSTRHGRHRPTNASPSILDVPKLDSVVSEEQITPSLHLETPVLGSSERTTPCVSAEHLPSSGSSQVSPTQIKPIQSHPAPETILGVNGDYKPRTSSSGIREMFSRLRYGKWDKSESLVAHAGTLELEQSESEPSGEQRGSQKRRHGKRRHRFLKFRK